MSIAASKIRAFGAGPASYASHVPSEICAVLSDASAPAHALAAAAELRLDGIPYYTGIQIDDRRAVVAAALANTVLLQAPGLEQRRRLFDAIAAESLPLDGGASQQSLSLIPNEAMETLRQLYVLADTILARSWTEYNRLAQTFRSHRSDVRIFAAADPHVPMPVHAECKRDAIVIWGPTTPAALLSLHAFAFEESHTPVIVVCSDGAQQPLRARFVSPSDGAEALRRAVVVVDATLSDPGTAIALSAHGVPVAVAGTSGAHEYIDSAYLYEPWSWRSILSAGSKALGGNAPRVRQHVSAATSLPVLEPPTQGQPAQPLVSIVIPTYNRRERLAKSLEHWNKQVYRPLELVLVNDGGENVDDIAAPYPFARVFNLSENRGIPTAVNRGVEQANGKYLLIAADDDHFAPDHIYHLVHALERTGCAVAHSNVIIKHEEALEDGRYATYGYSLVWNNTMDPGSVFATPVVAITGLLSRRDVYVEAGGWDVELPTMRDYNFILNLAKRHDFVHVDRTTAVYSSRPDVSSTGYATRDKIATALRMIYSRNPVNARPSIDMARQAELAAYESAGARPLFEPAMRLYPKS